MSLCQRCQELSLERTGTVTTIGEIAKISFANLEKYSRMAACLRDCTWVERAVEWVLRVNEDNEFYLHLSDIKGRRLPYDPSFCSRPVETEPFDFLKIPPEIQLMVLRYLSLSDLGSCRLTCRTLNSLIEGNWKTLESRNIGFVEFTPSLGIWHLRGKYMQFHYKRKLESFSNVVISDFVLFFSELTTSRIQSLTHILTQSRISIRKIIITIDTPCRCELEDVISLIESAHAKSLIIDVCGRIDLGRKLAMNPVIQRLQTVFIYSDGGDTSYTNYYMGCPLSSFDAITLKKIRVLMEVWQMDVIKLLHLHMPSYGDWTTDTKSVLRAVGSFTDRGNILCTDGGQRLRVGVSDDRVTFAYVEEET